MFFERGADFPFRPYVRARPRYEGLPNRSSTAVPWWGFVTFRNGSINLRKGLLSAAGLRSASQGARALLLSTERTVRKGFAALFVCLVVIAAVCYVTLDRLGADTAAAEHTHQVIAALRLLTGGMTHAETSGRGFIITGDATYLEPYHSALDRSNQALAELHRLTADNPTEQQQLDVLAPLVTQRVARLNQEIERRRQSFALAQALVLTGGGKELGDRIQAMVLSMEGTERALLARREAAERQSSAVAKLVVAGGSVLALIIVGAALWVIGAAFSASHGAEQALRASEARFRAVVENSHDGIFFFDAQGVLLYRSPSSQRLTGYADEERVGRSGFETVHPDDLAAVHQAWTQVLSRGDTIHNLCYRIRHKNGGWRWVEARFQNLLGSPDVEAVVLTVWDFTERKRAEEDLREQEAILRSFFDSPGMMRGIVELVDGRVIHVSCNAAAAELYGINREAIEGKTAAEAGTPEDAVQAWVCLYEEARSAGGRSPANTPGRMRGGGNDGCWPRPAISAWGNPATPASPIRLSISRIASAPRMPCPKRPLSWPAPTRPWSSLRMLPPTILRSLCAP